jgi:hypothetical protein
MLVGVFKVVGLAGLEPTTAKLWTWYQNTFPIRLIWSIRSGFSI